MCLSMAFECDPLSHSSATLNETNPADLFPVILLSGGCPF
jgi:hypothetical protein